MLVPVPTTIRIQELSTKFLPLWDGANCRKFVGSVALAERSALSECSCLHLNGSVKEPNKFHNYETEKINRKASDVAEYIKLFGSSTRDRHARHINVILWTSTDICIVVHDDLGWKNRTTQYNCRFSAMSLALRVIFVRRKRLSIYASCMTISGVRTKQHIVIGFGELAAVNIRLVY